MGLAFAIMIPLVVLGNIFDWSPEATGWPGLGVIGLISVLHVVMWQAEEDAREERQGPAALTRRPSGQR